MEKTSGFQVSCPVYIYRDICYIYADIRHKYITRLQGPIFWLRRYNTWVVCRQSCNRIGEFIKMSVSKLHPIHVSTQNILHPNRIFVKYRPNFHTFSLIFIAMATFSLRSVTPRDHFYKCLDSCVVCLSTARHSKRNNLDLTTLS